MFGVMSLFVMLVVHPAVDDFVAKINTNVAFVLSILFGTYFIVDTIITASTILHLNERLEKLHTLHEDLLKINTNVAFVLSILFGTYFIVDTIITASTILHLNERLEKLHTLHEDLLEKKKRHLEETSGSCQRSFTG